MGTFAPTSYNEFKKRCASFLRRTKEEELTAAQLNAGHHCILLSWVAVEEVTELQEHEACILIEMAGKIVVAAECNEILVARP